MIAEFISFLNIATDICIDVYTSVKKAAIAAINSRTPDTWVFLIRNAVPWVIKEPLLNTHSYSPSTGMFYITSGTALNKLDDLVIAEVVDASGILVLDNMYLKTERERFVESSQLSLYLPPRIGTLSVLPSI